MSVFKNPLVTIAVPTYNREKVIRRALKSIERQNYLNIEVLVVDNASEGNETEIIVKEFKDRIFNLNYEKLTNNIGPVENFFYCLQKAHGELFMWLADDDEISPACVEAMVEVFNCFPGASTAVPYWEWLRCPNTSQRMPLREYAANFWLLRVMKFVWKANDSFFTACTELNCSVRHAQYITGGRTKEFLSIGPTHTYLIWL